MIYASYTPVNQSDRSNSFQNVARALFSKLFDPSCFDSIFFTPASSKTVRVAPPAITPLPGAEGRKIRRAAPKRPVVACGIEFAPVNGTVITCFLPSF